MASTRRLSLRLRVSAAIVATVAAGVAAFGVFTYRIVRQSVVAAFEARALSVVQQLTALPQPAAVARDKRFRDVAAHPAVRAVLERRTPERVAAARAALAALGPDTGTIVSTALRDSTGQVVLAINGRPAAGLLPLGPTDTAQMSPLFVRGDSVLVEYGAPVRRGDLVIGRVTQVRTATSPAAPAALTRLRDLLGMDGATFLIGNVDGSVWTDMTRRVERPPPAEHRMVTYDRDGVRRVAVSSRYPTAPAVVALELPESVVVAPVRRLLWALVGMGTLIIAAAGAVAWWASSAVMRPIVELTAAAERIAAGDLSSPVVGAGAEPVGRLNRAFEAMRRSVKAAHDRLEEEVARRTQELHEAHAELVRKERLAILGQLSSSVGHELRNPLGVMTNAVYFLEMTVKDAPPKVREYLGILRTQIRVSEKIVSDLLDFARVKPPQRSSVPIGDIIDAQLERVTLPERVSVRRNVGSDVPPVYVDAVQVGQVVLNLIANAAQAMEETGGTLTLTASADDGVVRLAVTDTGPGIAPEHLDRVFEPLFTTKARGIGLGLSVSRALAAANSGRLTVHSEPGRGATFTLELPAREAS